MRGLVKRLFDLLFSAAGLILLFPLLAGIAILIRLREGGPVFFRQERAGQDGRLFRIWKFRTMVQNAHREGPAVTSGTDPRVTVTGRWLRKCKLDELPQLWNVFCGDMSLVGPRPEVQRYVALYTFDQRRVLALKPGITDLATLEFRHEEELLASADDVETFYIGHCIPRKIELNLRYAQQATIGSDIMIIVRTLIPAVDRSFRRKR